jgi:transcriptional regulator of NAD metabolism
MTGEERRAEILRTMQTLNAPVSGTALAKKYHVSRQVIVQDIALLRAAQYEIQSTQRGYRLARAEEQDGSAAPVDRQGDTAVYRIFHVKHSDAQMEDELNTIVDNGGKVLDVMVQHEVYGTIRGELNLYCRRQVKEFIEDIDAGKSVPLKNLTCGDHFHRVEADSEETLDIIEQELRNKKYLI